MKPLYLLVIVLVLWWLYFDTHFFDKRYEIKNFDAQGVECIKNGADKDLYIINGNNGGELYSFNRKAIVANFSNPEEKTQKKKFFLAHPTSFIIRKDGNGIVVNSMSRLPPKMVVYDFDTHLSDGYLTKDSILSVITRDDFKNLRLELISSDENSYVMLSGEKEERNVASFVSESDLSQICDIDLGENVQNMFWNEEDKVLFLSQNILKSRGSKVQRVKLLNLDSLKEGVCPEYKIISTTFFITPYELEAYAQCNNKEYYLYNNNPVAILYER